MNIKDDFNEIRQAIKMMNEQLKILKDLNDSDIIDGYGLDIRVRTALDRLAYTKIPEMDEADVLRFLRDNGVDDSNINALKEAQKHSEVESGWKDKPFDEYCRHVFSTIKDRLMQIRKLEKDKDDLSKEMVCIEDDYFNYVNSAEYKEKNRRRVQEMKQKAEDEVDVVQKASILRDLEYIENADTLNFLVERLDNVPKEVDTIASTYFDHNRSTHIMKKFSARMPRFGYNKDIYKFFFNLEETFLPEEYHVFNNLFLFHVMRTISYMNADNKRDQLYTNAILVKLYNLVYHKFNDQDHENEFINFIKNIEDRFREKWYDVFDKDNITQPKHPNRIAMENKADEQRRAKTIVELQKYGIEADTTLETFELLEQLRKAIEDDKNKKDAELEKWEAEHALGENVDNSEDEDIVYKESYEQELVDDVNTLTEQEYETDEVEVYVDAYGYYYRLMCDGTYTYFTDKDAVYETGICEDTVLMLANTGNVHKINRSVPV